MKTLPIFFASLALTLTSLAADGAWLNDVSKAISKAKAEKKPAFILMGREACGNCQATKRMVNGGAGPVKAADYVLADINVDDQRARAEFDRKFRKADFGETLPFVVVTDASGKAVASYSGFKSPEALAKMIEEGKAAAVSKK